MGLGIDLNFLVVIVLSIVGLSRVSILIFILLISILLIIVVIGHCVVRCVRKIWSVRI